MTLQASITNLQAKHSALVAAVQGRSTPLAETANDLILAVPPARRLTLGTVDRLRSQLEHKGQSLILDFANDVYLLNGRAKRSEDLITFNRASGGGRIGPDGRFEWLPADVPRIDYDPITGKRRGLLLEPSRSNYVKWTYWSNAIVSEGNSVTVTHDYSVAPDGSMTATRIVMSYAAGAGNCAASVGTFPFPSGSRPRIGSLYVKTNDGTTKTVGLASWGGAGTAQSVVGPKWTRIEGAAYTVDSTSASTLRLYLSSTTSSDVDVSVWLPQCEESNVVTSGIPPSSSIVVRAQDRAYCMNSGWLGDGAFTLFGKGTSFSKGSTYNALATISDGTASHRLGVYAKHSNNAQFTSFAYEAFVGSLALSQSAGFVLGEQARAALSGRFGSYAFSANGEQPVTSNASVYPTGLDRLLLGAGSSVSAETLCGWLESVEVFPTDLSAAELMELTA